MLRFRADGEVQVGAIARAYKIEQQDNKTFVFGRAPFLGKKKLRHVVSPKVLRVPRHFGTTNLQSRHCGTNSLTSHHFGTTTLKSRHCGTNNLKGRHFGTKQPEKSSIWDK